MMDREQCPYCTGPRKNLPIDETASDFKPSFADIESDDEGHCIGVGTPEGNVFLEINFCPKCGNKLKEDQK